MQKKIVLDKKIALGNSWTSCVILRLSVCFPVRNDEQRYIFSTSIRKHGPREFVSGFPTYSTHSMQFLWKSHSFLLENKRERKRETYSSETQTERVTEVNN